MLSFAERPSVADDCCGVELPSTGTAEGIVAEDAGLKVECERVVKERSV
jgi:hypothetical protein